MKLGDRYRRETEGGLHVTGVVVEVSGTSGDEKYFSGWELWTQFNKLATVNYSCRKESDVIWLRDVVEVPQEENVAG